MDRLAGLLDGPRARGAFLLRCLLSGDWGIDVRDEAPLTVIAVVHGSAWINQHGRLAHVPAGTVALVAGPEHYDVTSRPNQPTDVVIQPDQRCETTTGESLALTMRLGIRSWGNSTSPDTVMIVATYDHHSAVARDLLDTLESPALVVRGPADPLLDLITTELTNDTPGQQTVLDRLLDALTVDTLRRWYDDNDALAPAWWLGHTDPIVGEALRLIHDRPSDRWTIESLAAAVATSRANLARRFHQRIGEPPIAYLTRWRMSLGADLLAQPGRTIGEVAELVGYGSPFAFSTAFKRHHGISPNQHRVRETAPAPA